MRGVRVLGRGGGRARMAAFDDLVAKTQKQLDCLPGHLLSLVKRYPKEEAWEYALAELGKAAQPNLAFFEKCLITGQARLVYPRQKVPWIKTVDPRCTDCDSPFGDYLVRSIGKWVGLCRECRRKLGGPSWLFSDRD